MLVGYLRVSSDNDRQATDLQRDAWLAAGVDPRHVLEDKASCARQDRPGLLCCDGSAAIACHRGLTGVPMGPLGAPRGTKR
jgi:hypothetical protein